MTRDNIYNFFDNYVGNEFRVEKDMVGYFETFPLGFTPVYNIISDKNICYLKVRPYNNGEVKLLYVVSFLENAANFFPIEFDIFKQYFIDWFSEKFNVFENKDILKYLPENLN